MDTDHDYLGFTKQTETVLCGVGAQNLIKEFKSRNISTSALHKLTKQDFVQLGADENQAGDIVNALCISKKDASDIRAKPHHKIPNKVEMLQLSERQLSIIQDFVKYCRMKLAKERINCFVEPDKALSASHILCLVADAALKEVVATELKLKELEAVIVTPSKSREYSYILYSVPLGGLCITTYILLNRFWR